MSSSTHDQRKNINCFEATSQEPTMPVSETCSSIIGAQPVKDTSQQHDAQSTSDIGYFAPIFSETPDISIGIQASEKTHTQRSILQESEPNKATSVSTKKRFHSQSDVVRKHQYWRAPLLMISGLSCGLAIALVQHFLNSKLNGQQVAVIDTKFHIPQAQILSMNTLLAFLVQTALVGAAGVAIVQWQWLNMHHNVFTIEELDNITDLRCDLTSFLEKKIWSRSPVLAILAIISWIMPVALIVVPSTLTVDTVSTTRQNLDVVAQLDYNSTAWTNIYSQTSNAQNTSSQFHPIANSTVYRAMYAAASSGQILALQSRLPNASYPNASYHLDFFAPRLKCENASRNLTEALTSNFGRVYDNGMWQTEIGIIDFASFVQENFTSYLGLNSTITPNASNILTDYLDYSNDSAHIYFMSNGGQWLGSSKMPTTEGQVDWAIGGQAMVNATDCRLYNASYSVDFNFSFPNQNIEVHTDDKNLVSFGNVLPLSYHIEPPVDPSLGNTTYVYTFDPTINAYASIMQSFGRFFVGVSLDFFWGARQGWEILPFQQSNFQLMPNLDNTDAEKFANGIEEMFQNFTVSLLSEPLLSSANQTPLVPVSITTSPATYIYAPRNLLIAYGLAYISALICCLFGAHAFLVNGGSYQNRLSTYLRATNKAGIHLVIPAEDPGTDPLPKTLGQMPVLFRSVPPSVASKV